MHYIEEQLCPRLEDNLVMLLFIYSKVFENHVQKTNQAVMSVNEKKHGHLHVKQLCWQIPPLEQYRTSTLICISNMNVANALTGCERRCDLPKTQLSNDQTPLAEFICKNVPCHLKG